MVQSIKEEIIHIKNILSKWPDIEYITPQGKTLDSDQAFTEIESNLRQLMDKILQLPENDRIQLRDTIGDFKDMMEKRHKETEQKLEELRAQATLSKSAKNAMRAYSAPYLNQK
ncbi:MAG: hypothetical protein Q8K36_03830 [Alphaproteobacteria bacterium]|nr:hypothetical protein [Alphaproteobacteria bacterium]